MGKKAVTSLLAYAEQKFYLRYEDQLVYLDKNKVTIEGSIKTFTESTRCVRKEMIQLKTLVETLLADLNQSLELSDVNEGKELISVADIAVSIENRFEELKTAVNNRDLPFIISKLNDRIQPLEIDDTATILVNDISKHVSTLTDSKELDSLSESIRDV